jgi:hypothetical protein
LEVPERTGFLRIVILFRMKCGEVVILARSPLETGLRKAATVGARGLGLLIDIFTRSILLSDLYYSLYLKYD